MGQPPEHTFQQGEDFRVLGILIGEHKSTVLITARNSTAVVELDALLEPLAVRTQGRQITPLWIKSEQKTRPATGGAGVGCAVAELSLGIASAGAGTDVNPRVLTAEAGWAGLSHVFLQKQIVSESSFAAVSSGLFIFPNPS
tara:strand:- start:1121 stop:1546 length:426 start_codon:yes stop_codon:yes gene_type:complete